ncbi:MAG: glycosyltransferase [Clostridiales bacterium]|nr:glycosyltransferase [Clostridiales bacterium]
MPRRQRVLVLSASFGGGHWSAARAVQEYLATHHGDSVEVKVIDFFEEFVPSLNVLAKFAYQQSIQFLPVAYGTFFDLSNKLPANPVVHELRIMGLARAAEFIDSWDPDAVVSTFPVAGGVVADLKETRPIVSATVITDFGAHRTWLHPATDLYFVACSEVRDDLVARGIAHERVVVSGIPIRERFAEQAGKSAARASLGLAEEFTVMLAPIAGGTSDAVSLASALKDLGVQVLAVAGSSERLKKRLDAVARGGSRVRVFGYVEDINRVMQAADILVGKAGGLTVSEALALKLPLLIYNPVPGQELYNVDFLVNYGAGLMCRDEDDVVEKVRFMATHPQRLQQMEDNAGALGKPAASQTICERVLAEVRTETK